MARIHKRAIQKKSNNYNGVVTHLGLKILEFKVKWDLESITMNKGSGVDWILAGLFKILKDDPIKVLTQYVRKFGKLISGHRTEEDQFSFQLQRRAMPKNIQTTVQLCSFYMLVRLCSKSFKLGFSRVWTVNFQMLKLDLEKAEEQAIRLPTLLDHRESKGIPEKHLFLFHLLR